MLQEQVLNATEFNMIRYLVIEENVECIWMLSWRDSMKVSHLLQVLLLLEIQLKLMIL